MNYTHLKEMTSQLLEYNRSAAAIFLQCRKTGEQGDFYSEVKPFADKVKTLSEEWEPEAIDWLSVTKPKNLYPLQIKNTTENLQMVAIRAFFPDTSLKRFKSHIQSIEYVLERILEALKENKSPGK
ncbi:DUF1798 family protein [Siminovitchia acidinfaciens]|uniref:DUF1798 family protein n=1 Tax=Siminovitchia acidinfaciens TaxID=2321395 RepID=A0A429XY05_9BACI|nr:YppE family protein [Siminovitchia acidinfaciens]RST73633.1 DUF1798 family protein [Siminovitchia acidinfaciens]